MRILSIIFFVLVFNISLKAQNNVLNTYNEAEKWLNISDKIYKSNISCNWIGEGNKFWYSAKTSKGLEYFLVDIRKKSKKQFLNKESLSSLLNTKFKLNISANDLKLRDLSFIDGDLVKFKVDTLCLELNLSNYKIKSISPEKKIEVYESLSPDKKKIAFIKDYNLYVKDISTSNIEQLSFDGDKDISYACSLSWYFVRNESLQQKDEYEIDVKWSPDSKYIISTKYNRKKSSKLFLYQSNTKKGFRAQVHSYDRALAGDKDLTRVSYAIFDIEKNSQIETNIPENASFLEYPFQWKTNTLAYMHRYIRGYKEHQVISLDVRTGEWNVVVNEKSETYVDPNMYVYNICKKNNEFICSSEQDNWNQLYLYDLKSGKLKNKITKENCVVREITKVDEDNRTIYFRANGIEKGDPYYVYLYSINFDGRNLKLLSPVNAYHYASLSKNNKYIFDRYSRVDLPDKCVVRKASNGKKIMDVEQADISEIIKMGWKAPEMFKLKARDNTTDIYGLIYRPFNISKDKKYPIVDATYSGPQTIRTPKTFLGGLKNMDVSIAQLGFVVMTIDGLGSAFRSKKFHDFSYRNLGDIGCLDHIKAIKEMSVKYSNFDDSKVGIYGHSAGGYDATRALIIHPEFYSVAVSSAGNHDHRMAKAWWPELYMGFPAGTNYDQQSNVLHADKLKGKLLLVHGNMDNNVNPASSMKMADALINANKDFELLLIPNCNHSTLYYNKYFLRKRWDFFMKNLKNSEIPKEYIIK